MPLDEEGLHAEAPKTDPRYYFRPYKTILVRTVADGGESHYVQGDHRNTVPTLYHLIRGAVSDVDAERLHDLVSRFGTCRIAVLGDFFLDKYLDVEPAIAEVSLETGKAAHQVVSVRCSPGAAGTVVNNLAALGAGEILALGITGDDGEGYELRRALEGLGCDVRGLFTVPGRFTPTYLKPRDLSNPALSGEHDRYDTKNRRADAPRLPRNSCSRT